MKYQLYRFPGCYIETHTTTYQTAGMEQYAIKKFAEAFEVFPKILAENTGLKANEVLANMYNAHQDKISGINAGINLEVSNLADL